MGNVSSYFKLIREDFFDAIHPILKEKGQVEAAEVAAALTKVVSAHHAKLKSEESAEGMTEEFSGQLRAKYFKHFKGIREKVFEKVKISGTAASRLYDIAAYIHTKQIFSTGVSGLVIAGYGEKEIYPTVITYDVEGVVEDRLKYRLNMDKTHSIKTGHECRIIACAQEDMVATFMQGINPQVLYFLESYLQEAFRRLPELLDGNKNDNDDKKQFKARITKLLKGLFDEFGGHLNDEQAQPVLRMVAVLPKDELAAMAEALVNLTETSGHPLVVHLARYTHRIALSNAPILGLDDDQVSLSYRDGQHKTLPLDAPELVRRFLLHLLPKGLMRVRCYGLLANRCRVQPLAQIRKILAAPPPEPKPEAEQGHEPEPGWPFPVCRRGRMRQVRQIPLRPAALGCAPHR